MTGTQARRRALDVLTRIEEHGAYANLALRHALRGSGLARRDKAMVTDLVYGVTRMRRALDHVIDLHVSRQVDPSVRRVLRLGAHQMLYGATPAHAAVSESVDLAPGRASGFVNAVLRKVAATDLAAVEWPDEATRLSYPDWIVARLVADLGEADALAALEQMDEAPEVEVRSDGYTQDRASQWVADLVEAEPGHLVADTCAGPGGKATALARTGARVVALDHHLHRARMVADNAQRVQVELAASLVADARRLPLRPGSFHRVLVDAPCSGLGVLRRRADARWRVLQSDVDELADLQVDLVLGALPLLRPGGVLTYSVCTVTAAETTGVTERVLRARPDLVPLDPPGPPWRVHGAGALLLPHDAGTDGMYVLRIAAPSA